MSKADDGRSADEAGEHIEERVDESRREALTRFAKYTAPAMLALLLSSKQAALALS
jgi:hypothetical protein